MEIINASLVSGKKVILRYDIDVALKDGEVAEDFKLKAGIPTLNLCLEHGQSVVMMGHIGRPDGQRVPKLSVAPIHAWFENHGYSEYLGNGRLRILENLRFDPREEACEVEYARKLANMGDVYINEAFSAYRPAVSTTVLPTLLPHGAGLRFVEEVNRLTELRNNPKRPFVVIMGGGGGGKDEQKLPAIQFFAQFADAVLVGGKLVAKIRDQSINLPPNVLIGKLTEDGFDIAPETTEAWRNPIMRAAMIFWNGPLGKYEDPKNDQTKRIAQFVVESEAESIIGGGDTIAAVDQAGVLERISYVSVGGGADVKFFADGTLPTIEALR